MHKWPWWIWLGGGLLLVLLANAVLGGALHLLGILLAGIFTVLKDVLGLAFALAGAALGSLVNVLVLGGLGYLGYRRWRGRQPLEEASSGRGER